MNEIYAGSCKKTYFILNRTMYHRVLNFLSFKAFLYQHYPIYLPFPLCFLFQRRYRFHFSSLFPRYYPPLIGAYLIAKCEATTQLSLFQVVT